MSGKCPWQTYEAKGRQSTRKSKAEDQTVRNPWHLLLRKKEFLPSHSQSLRSLVTCWDLFWSLVLLNQYQLLLRTSQKSFFPISSIYFPKATEEQWPKHQPLSKTWTSQVTDLAATSILLKREFYAIPLSRTYSNSLLLLDPSISVIEHCLEHSPPRHTGTPEQIHFLFILLSFIEHLLTGHAVHRWLRHDPHPREALSFLEETKGEAIITTHWGKLKLKMYTQNSVKPERRIAGKQTRTSAGLSGMSTHLPEGRQRKGTPGWVNGACCIDLSKAQKTVRKADYCYTAFGISLCVRDYIGFRIVEMQKAEPGIVHLCSRDSIVPTR